MDYIERLRRLAINDEHLVDGDPGASPDDRGGRVLDARTMALARLAALVAVGGSVPSFSSLVADAVGSGATAEEMVDVLVGIGGVVGGPRVVAAAPRLALALGHDLDDEDADPAPSEWRR